MSTTLAEPRRTSVSGGETRSRADAAIFRRALRQTRLGATICALVFGGTAAASALSYVSSFATAASRHQLALTTGRDSGLAVLLGPIASVDTVGGYTVYKGFVFLTTIGAIWALLTATRLLRGEEDAGRWQLVLAGSTRASRATAATLGALATAVGVIFVGTTLITLLAARKPDVGFGTGETLLYGLSIVAPAAVFGAVGAVTAQLGRTRRTATGLGVAVFAIAFVVRMIADSGSATRWLLWATPFGWSELMRPLTRNDAWPLVPAVAAVLVLGVTAVLLASVRDAGDGLLATRDVAPLRPFGLRSPFGLAARLELPVLISWCVGAAAAGFGLGMITKIATDRVPDSLADTLDKFGVHGRFEDQYLGVAFLLVATVVGLLPAAPVGAASEEETSGRLVLVMAQPARRTSWFAGRLALTAAGIVVAGVVAGLGAWLGAESQGVGLGLATMLGAGVNVVPTALLALGIGAVVLSVAPRAAAVSVYAVVGWSLIVDLLASTVSGMGWLDHLSLFHSMALAPAEDPVASTLAITTVAALALCVVATVVFRRRDLRAR